MYEDTQRADMERRVSATAEILNSSNIHRCFSTFVTQWGVGGRKWVGVGGALGFPPPLIAFQTF